LGLFLLDYARLSETATGKEYKRRLNDYNSGQKTEKKFKSFHYSVANFYLCAPKNYV